MVVPRGMEPMRVKVLPTFGLTVLAGTSIQNPVSTWMIPGSGLSPLPVLTLVTSVTVCRYETPLRKMSGCSSKPRLGTQPNGLLKDSSCREVRFEYSDSGARHWLGKLSRSFPAFRTEDGVEASPRKVPLKNSKTPNDGSSGFGCGSGEKSTGAHLTPPGSLIP